MDLVLLAWISLGLAFLCALVIAANELRHPQTMGIMNIVWPITALYFSIFAVIVYFKLGRKHTKAAMQKMGSMKMASEDKQAPPTAAQVAVGTSHCGAGCTIADVTTEFALAATGLTLFGSMLAASYIFDFLIAWAVGILFQYFALRPMRSELSVGHAIVAAIKADTLSILAFQIGMYAFMALTHFVLFPSLTAFDPRYWLFMQIAMICGFATSYPMNRFLIQRGLKEKM